MLPKLLLAIAAVLAVSLACFTSKPGDFVSKFPTFNRSSHHSERNANTNEDDERESWHPLFQHSRSPRTADVEVEVPNQKTSGARASLAKTESVTIGEPAGMQQGAAANENGNPGYERGTSRRRLQEEGEEPTFLEGEMVQELCPATHTLLSQSLILRSSYGNIFSITTPDGPTQTTKRKRSVTDDVHRSSDHRGAEPFRGGGNGDGNAASEPHDEDVFLRGRERDLQNADPLSVGSGTGGSYEDTGNYNDIDTTTESIYDGTGIETITIRTLSLRMADFRPNEDTHFEVWLYTGSGDEVDFELNENDVDDDPTNDNFPGMVPSKGEYQADRARFSDWQLVTEGMEKELEPDTDFFDHNGHVFNIGTGTTIGPLGRLDNFENMEDVTLAARQWNRQKLREDGGMDAITAEGEVTTTFYYKIPEEKFPPLKLPKHNGKLTLFVTLDRVGLQYGYAAKREFDKIDVNKHDYIDQTPSLDVLNGNVDMRMHVGEGVIFYPWMEEEFFYQTRRFLGKIWYDAKIPCEYVNYQELLDGEDRVPSMPPTSSTDPPSQMPSMAPSLNGTNITAAVLISVLIKDEREEMPPEVKEIFETTVLNFVDDSFGDFCPLVWNEGATVTEQEVSPIGGTPAGASDTARRKRDSAGHAVAKRREPDEPPEDDGGMFLRRKLLEVLEPIFAPETKSRQRLLQAITVLDATTSIDALYSAPSCPDKTPEEWANLIENFINDNKAELLDRLKAAHDYFKDAFGISADAIDMPTEIRSSEMETEEEDDNTKWIILAALLALLLCCCCCLLPLLILKRRKRKESKENEIIGEDIEWARPVTEDYYPPMGGPRDDEDDAYGAGLGGERDDARMRKRPDGEMPEFGETPPALGLVPIPPGLRPPEDDTQMLHSTNWLDRDESEDPSKKRAYGMPGRLPGEEDETDPYNINIYPGGDYEDGENEGEGIDLRPVTKEKTEEEDSDWEPEHYEPDGGVHGYERGTKSTSINAGWDRLPKRELKETPKKKKLTIKELVLQRKKDLEAKMAQMRHVENIEAGLSDSESSQEFEAGEPDDRIEDLMGRIKGLEKNRAEKYQRPQQQLGESDYEVWRRLNIGNDELSSSSESSDEDVQLAAARKKKKKKKKKGDDYMLRFDDLDAYNRALAVHQDAYIHKWVKVKVEKGEGEEGDEDGANLDDIEMEGPGAEGPTEEEMAEYYKSMGIDPPPEEVGKAGPPEEVGQAAAADNNMRDRRLQLEKQKTEYIGDFDDLGDMDQDDEDSEEGLEVPLTAAAGAPAGPSFVGRDRRLQLEKQKTEYIGDFDDLGDIDDGDDSAAAATPKEDDSAPQDRRSAMSRQKTEYIGSIRGMDDDGAGASPATDRRATMSRQKTEYIGSIRGMDDDEDVEEPDLSTAGGRMRAAMSKKAQQGGGARVGSALQSKGAPPAAAPRKSALKRASTVRFGSIPEAGDEDTAVASSSSATQSAMSDRRTQLSKQKTEYIGDFELEDEDDDDAPAADRRSAMSRQKTEYIGSIRGMDEGGDTPTDRRATMSRQKTEYIGSIRGMDEGDDDDKPTDRRAMMGRQQTEYIGSIRGMEEGDDDDADAPTDRRAMMGRQQTEYIGSIRGMEEGDDDDTPTDRRAMMGRQQTEYIGSIRGMEEGDDDDADAPTDRRAMMGRQQTEYIGSIRGMEDDDDDNEQQPLVGRRAMMGRQKTEYIGSIRGINEEEEEEDEEDLSTPGGRMRARMRKKRQS